MPCRQAFREGDPYGTGEDELQACSLYRSFFMLFRGIQVAGPFLTPDAIDQGNHALPRVDSKDSHTAACYYDPGDFTCVKDAQESWWDPDIDNPNQLGFKGCWRLEQSGRRYTAGKWTQEQLAFNRQAGDPCNTVSDNTSNINPTGALG